MFLKKNFNKQKGFSLIELLTVMAIMGLIAAIVLPNYFLTQKRLALGRSAEKLVHDIKRAQGMAMSAKEITSCPAGYKYGYGVYFSSSTPGSYQIFADCDANGDYASPPDQVVETINFEKWITISNLIPASPLRVVFTPPLPSVIINPNSSTTTITITNGAESKSITVNKAGLVENQ